MNPGEKKQSAAWGQSKTMTALLIILPLILCRTLAGEPCTNGVFPESARGLALLDHVYKSFYVDHQFVKTWTTILSKTLGNWITLVCMRLKERHRAVFLCKNGKFSYVGTCLPNPGSGRVFSGFGIWLKYGAGIGNTINILTGSRIWLFPRKRDSPKNGHGIQDLCLRVCRECQKPSRLIAFSEC